MFESIQLAIQEKIQEFANKVDQLAKDGLPNIADKLVEDTFQSSGTNTGRNWQPNTKNTIKKKGFDKRNIEEGDLEATLSSNGFILDDDYMAKLPKSKKGGDYKYANEINDYANRFDNLGRTPNDEKYIKNKLLELIKNAYR